MVGLDRQISFTINYPLSTNNSGESNAYWLVVTSLLLATANTFAADKIKLTLNWVPEPEFGGIYAAKENGTFAKHGLDVDVVPGGAGTPTWQLVANGKADFAVTAPMKFSSPRREARMSRRFSRPTRPARRESWCTHRGGSGASATFSKAEPSAMEPGLPYVEFQEQIWLWECEGCRLRRRAGEFSE